MSIVFSFFLSFFINPKQKNSKLRSFSLSLPHTILSVREPLCLSSFTSWRETLCFFFFFFFFFFFSRGVVVVVVAR